MRKISFENISEELRRTVIDFQVEIDYAMEKMTTTMTEVGSVLTQISNSLQSLKPVSSQLSNKKTQKTVKETGKMFDKIKKSKAGGVLGMITSLIQKLGVLEPIMDFMNAIFGMIGGSLMESLMPAFEELFSILSDPTIREVMKLIGQIIALTLVPPLKMISTLFEVLAEVIPMDTLTDLTDWLSDAFEPAMEWFGDFFRATFYGILNAVGGAVYGVWWAVVVVANAIGTVIYGIWWLVSVIANAIIGIINAVLSAYNGVAWLWGGQVDLLDYIDLPDYADFTFDAPPDYSNFFFEFGEGGLVQSPIAGIVGEGNEDEIISPVSTMEDIVQKNGNQEQINETNRKLDILIELQERQIALTMKKERYRV